jgi:hypothetical protein
MKRHVELRRSSLSRSTKPMNKVNPEQKARRKARRPRLTASVRKAVLERDGHQCTERIAWWGSPLRPLRCPETECLEVHHEHYKQTPENPLDGLKLLCRYHHHLLESQIRPWNRGRLGR